MDFSGACRAAVDGDAELGEGADVIANRPAATFALGGFLIGLAIRDAPGQDAIGDHQQRMCGCDEGTFLPPARS
jgi:hypothetical protein